ncbi:alpha-2 adrenergic receptor-like, partial [Teleopsis dalmanni]
MDYSQLDANINSNLNTGNISTHDFLAIFSSTSPTDVAGGGPGGGNTTSSGSILSTKLHTNASHIASTGASNVTLNPPLLTVDGQYTVANILESSLAGIATTLNPNYINDSLFYLNSNFFNSSTSTSYGGYGIGGSSINFSSGNYYNQTFANSTGNITEIQWNGRYPSGYTLTHIVIASIIVTFLMIIIVVGNMLVIIAIVTEKSLKNIQNWFIASLAVADFFLGLIIMPFSLANELMGYWIFGSWWCDIHSAMDVLLCTASIMNLCLISLDRYWSITKAVDYLKSRTPARAAVMIAAVWIMSALICIP